MVVSQVKRWIKGFVIEYNICPFAQHEIIQNGVRFVKTDAESPEMLLAAFEQELDFLNMHDDVATTLLIHPKCLENFMDYNDFLSIVDQVLINKKLEGIFQIASFHPDYQFAGTNADDAENYTNRSPYPMLHILRESSVEKAVAFYSDIEQIPIENIKTMNVLGKEKLAALLLQYSVA